MSTPHTNPDDVTTDISSEYVDTVDEGTVAPEDGATPETEDGVPPQYGVGPFSIREAALIGVWAVLFIISFFPFLRFGFGGGGVAPSLWGDGFSWILPVGVPTVAVFLIVLRRFSPDGIRRVGTLGIDQFASVAFSVAAAAWIWLLLMFVPAAAQLGELAGTWVLWIGSLVALGGVVLTVFAPLIPTLREDFLYRSEVPAHPAARPRREISPRPVVERPAVAAPIADEAEGTSAPDSEGSLYASAPEGNSAVTESSPYAYSPETDSAAAPSTEESSPFEVVAPSSFDALPGTESNDDPPQEEVVEEAPVAASQAFWALVPEERPIVDDAGTELFTIGPTAWALVIEDRGTAFVVRHEDGRVGYLTDTSDVTRG